MLRVINTSRTFNQVRVAGPKPRVINLEAMGTPESSASLEACEVAVLEGTAYRVFATPDPEPVKPAPTPAPAPAPKAKAAAKPEAAKPDEVK